MLVSRPEFDHYTEYNDLARLLSGGLIPDLVTEMAQDGAGHIQVPSKSYGSLYAYQNVVLLWRSASWHGSSRRTLLGTES